MKLFLWAVFIHLFTHGDCSNSDINIGYKVTLAVPLEYSSGFIGRALIMESNQTTPNFKVALSFESVDQKFSCSLDVFLGDVKVWSSGHFSRFYTTEKCVLELTQNGDLKLKGQSEIVGWRTGTSGQDVKRLTLLRTGNLVLVDTSNLIKWQSFNFPTNIMLWGQRLNVATRLTSFPTNSTSFFSFEIQRDKLALYLNSGSLKYSYWEFKPSGNRNITFIKVASKGLEVFGDEYKKIAQILPGRPLEPLRFLALGNETGDLGLYYYSSEKGKFEPSFQAPNATCDLPLACEPYGICTLSNVCSCIRFVGSDDGDGVSSNCSSHGTSAGLCGENRVEMIGLQGVTSVLRGSPVKINVSKDECADSCVDDCSCVAALYNSFDSVGDGSNLGDCFLYGLVTGIKQVPWGSGSSYLVKVRKRSSGDHGKSSGLKKWVLAVVGVADGLIIVLVLGGVCYYLVQKRRRSPQDAPNDTLSLR